jgi:hypothetical protein
MRRAFLVFLMLALPALAGGQKAASIPYPGTTDSFVVPADSPVRFSGFNADKKGAIFSGRFPLAGTYYYGDGEYNDSPTFEGEAAIIPDAGIARRLPKFMIRGTHGHIFIGNADAFADAVLSKATLIRVRRKNGGYATGHIAIWVDRFRGAIVCDGPEFSVRFLSLYKPPSVRLAANEPRLGC